MSALYRHCLTIADEKEELEHGNIAKAITHSSGKHWVFQLERGERAGKLHWQCRVQLGTKKRCTTLLHELSASLSCESSRITVRPEADATGSFNYCCKEESRVKGPWADSPIYLGRDLGCMEAPLPWQKSIIDCVKTEPDDRSIYWVCDPVGNNGKSKLCKWLRWKKLAVRVPLGTATQIKTSVIEKGAARCYLVDLPRVRGGDETRFALFSAIEDIKNGWVESSMYGKAAELMMEPPHVFVFSNEMPDFGMASVDRWRVYTLNKGVLQAVPRAPVVPAKL